MSKNFLLIDGNNIAHASQSLKTLTQGDMEVQAIYGVLRTLRNAVQMVPNNVPIVLWDGNSWRKGAYLAYKKNRDKEATTAAEEKAQAARASLIQQKPFIYKSIAMLGVQQMIADNMEADDLAAIMVRRFKDTDRRIVLMSGDKDWVQLIGKNVVWVDPIDRKGTSPQRITLKTLEHLLGVKTPSAFVEAKALMGDVSDNITGVGGIGKTGALELLNTYGSVAGFQAQYLDGTLTKLPKKFEALATDPEKHAIFARNMRLMDLNCPRIPKPVNMRMLPSRFSKEAFHKFCRTMMFGSILRNFDEFCASFDPELHEEAEAA